MSRFSRILGLPPRLSSHIAPCALGMLAKRPDVHLDKIRSRSSSEMLIAHDAPAIDLPDPKRLRQEVFSSTQPVADLKPGAIVKIRMQNFMTYDDITYEFGPALNMIIGPNGSGKSTVVAGICIGLGFDPKIMGRADKVEATIKHGTQTATIEIELRGNKGESNVLIMRQFSHGSNGGKGQNDWHINGKRSTHKAVQERVRAFKCQIDNLCQFLPQDKVASFARMKPVEMLAATLRTIGNGSLEEVHSTLIDLQTKLNHELILSKTEIEKLKGLQARQEVLERDVARFKERQALQQELDIREKRLPFAKYAEAKALHQRQKEVYQATKAEVVRLKTIYQSTEQQEIQLLGTCDNTKRLAEEAKKRLDHLAKRVEEKGKPLAQMEDSMSSLAVKYKQEKDAEKANKLRIRELRERVAKDTRALGVQPDVKDELAKIVLELTQMNAADRDDRQELRELEQYLRQQKDQRVRNEEEIQRKETELASLDDIRGIRLKLLRSKNPDAADAVTWLQSNKDKFEHRVYDPVLLEVQVTNKKYAKAAQHVIMQNAYTFTCQSRKDYQTFNDLLVDNQGAGRRLRLNVVEWSRTSAPRLRDQKAALSSAEIKDLGMDGYLLDCLDGPEAVLNTLCHLAHINTLPVGTRELQHADIVAIEGMSRNGRPAIQRYIINATDTKIFRSYGQVSSESQAIHNDAAIFSHIVDVTKKKQLEHEIEEIREAVNSRTAEQNEKKKKYETLGQTLKAAADAKRKVNEQRQQLQQRKSSWQKAKSKLDSLEQELDRLQNAPAEYQDNMADIKRKQVESTKLYTDIALQLTGEIKAAQIAYEKYVVRYSAQLQAEADKAAFDSHNITAQAELKYAEDAMDSAKLLRDQALTDAKRIQNVAAESLTDMTDAQTELIRNYDTSITVEDLEVEIEGCRSRMNLLAATDGNVIDHYEARAREMENLQDIITRRNAILKDLADDIAERRVDFEQKLETMRASIDASFGEAFKSIDCLGEIRIGKPEEFAQWTLEIWVQFRDTDSLQMLTGERQSGGERSVSTIFYLMALQSLSVAPFRVVDEINQGMDQRNERQVHARIVQVACQTTTSQYFLITPKLLTDLEYHANMKVHCVTGGNLGKSGNKIDYTKYLAALRAQKSLTQGPTSNGHE